MKSDVFHAYDPTSVRDSVLGVRMSRSPLTIINPSQSSVPQIGYKLPFSSDLVRYSTRLERRNDDILEKATHHGEGAGRLFIGEAHPNQLRTQETAPSSTFCRACPQYGHALIFPRKCYYEAQCPLPLLFCANQHGERPVRTRRIAPAITHPEFPTLVRTLLRRLSSTFSKKIAYNDPTRENTNFGWRKKV